MNIKSVWSSKFIFHSYKHQKVIALAVVLWTLAGIKLQAQTVNKNVPEVKNEVENKVEAPIQKEMQQPVVDKIPEVKNQELPLVVKEVPEVKKPELPETVIKAVPISKIIELTQPLINNEVIKTEVLPINPNVLIAPPEFISSELIVPETPQDKKAFKLLERLRSKQVKSDTKPTDAPSGNIQPKSDMGIDGVKIRFQNDSDSEGRVNGFIEPTFDIRLPNDQKLRVKTGFNTFEQPNIDTVTNIPVQLGWEGKVGEYTVQTGAGIDIFNRLPAAVNINVKVDTPIFVKLTPDDKLQSGLFISSVVEQGPYKFNAKTLENQITAWRFGPNIYWQIDPNTSFYTQYRRGSYNDGNAENQLVSRLEHKFGDFFVAANLFSWSYAADHQNSKGYFSPSDFLVYNGEVGWEGNISNALRCRVTTNLGQQRLQGQFDNAFGYQGRCTVKVTDKIEADFGYGNTNVRQQSSAGHNYDNQTVSGELRFNF